MASNDLKLEIQRLIDRVPESALTEIHAALKIFVEKQEEALPFGEVLSKILSEDAKLLRRLAQ